MSRSLAARTVRQPGPGNFPTRWNPSQGQWNPRQVTTSTRQTVWRDPYMGDPGIFGDIGRFIGGAVKSIPVVGGLVGSGITALSNKLDPIRTAPGLPTLSGATLPILQQQAGVVKTPGLLGVAQRAIPGGETGYLQAGPAPSGYHWNKADYFLRDGTFVAKGSKLVKNRRRNPANSRATNRAISRVASAKKHAQTLSRITIRKK
jgi:hypothetical protein